LKTSAPKVSVICTCYNHEKYVADCIQSVMDQDYGNFELIVVDDGSTDGSVDVIESFLKKYPAIAFIKLKRNIGICRSFNAAFKTCSGDFIIDLAADDLLLPTRLSRGVAIFESLNDDYGVIFGDAEWINEKGGHLHFHSAKFPHNTVPRGDIYRHLVERYFICSPTMMFRRAVVDFMGGYNESLTYEDFDFWIRSSRRFKYQYDPEVLVRKRKVRNSLSHEQFKLLNRHSNSTYQVCVKILQLNRSTEERRVLGNRLRYEIRQSIRTLNFGMAYRYTLLWIKNKSVHY
jgi:glycosyltransferase involved in cell wall biosynthesis